MPRGFTLFEVIIAIAIFLVVVGVSVAGFRSGNDGTTLRLAAERVQDAIRNAQTRTESGQTTSVCPAPADAVCPAAGACADGTPCVARFPAGGYGVRAEPGKTFVALFVDLDGDMRLSTGETLETLLLDPRKEVLVRNNAGDKTLDAVFIPPAATIRLNADQAQVRASIVLTHPRVETARSVNLNVVSGRVY